MNFLPILMHNLIGMLITTGNVGKRSVSLSESSDISDNSDKNRNLRNILASDNRNSIRDYRNEVALEGCESAIVYLGLNTVKISAKPVGSCPHCCPLRPKTQIRFFFYNKFKPNGKLISKGKRGALRHAGFNKNATSVIFVHGFMELSPNGAGPIAIKNAYLTRREEFNIIVLDWSALSTAPWYMESTVNTYTTGAILAKFIRFYARTGEIDIEKLHLIGFSLGAHISGFAGKLLRDLSVPRITGLDPAYPFFLENAPDKRLNKGDARFVDVIHTNPGIFGYPVDIGNVDFYVNHGNGYQPGCSLNDLTHGNKIDDFLSCSHLRAWQYYAESVTNPTAFPATKCKPNAISCPIEENIFMGFNTSRQTKGTYFLRTKSTSPFGRSAQ